MVGEGGSEGARERERKREIPNTYTHSKKGWREGAKERERERRAFFST